MTQHCYISGPHPDYYLLTDEQSDHIFFKRLAAHVREAGHRCDGRGVLASGMLEIWIDDGSKEVWYIFDGGRAGDRSDTERRS